MVTQPLTLDVAPLQGGLDVFSKTLTRIPVTKTLHSITGQETLTEGTSTTFRGVLFQNDNRYSRVPQGVSQNGDAELLIKPDVVLNKDDLVSYNGIKYRVQSTIPRMMNGTTFYIKCDLFVTER